MSDDVLEEQRRRVHELDAQARAICAEMRQIHRDVVAKFELGERIAKLERDVVLLRGRLDRRDAAARRG